MYPTITIDRRRPLTNKTYPGDFRFIGEDTGNKSVQAIIELLARCQYNQSMEGTEYVYGGSDTPEYLTSLRDSFNLGNQQQQKFIRDTYRALFRAIPQEKQFLFEGYCFETYEAEDESIVIEFITPTLYFSIDIEERAINSSWTFSIKKSDGSRISRGDFFNDKLSIRNVIDDICRRMIQWMEYGWIS